MRVRHVAWGGYIWGPGMPGRSLEDLERAKAKQARRERARRGTDPTMHRGGRVEIRARGGGWYDLLVNGKAINKRALRQSEAKEMADELLGSR